MSFYGMARRFTSSQIRSMRIRVGLYGMKMVSLRFNHAESLQIPVIFWFGTVKLSSISQTLLTSGKSFPCGAAMVGLHFESWKSRRTLWSGTVQTFNG